MIAAAVASVFMILIGLDFYLEMKHTDQDLRHVDEVAGWLEIGAFM